MEIVVKCPKCEKRYKLDSAKIPEKGAKITCPKCGNVFVVRKDAEEEKEDFIPCSVCGNPATIGLDTDKPLCERCKTHEEEKAARFVNVGDDRDGGSPMDRELHLKGAGDVSFDSLSGGDFSHDAYSTEILPDKGKSYVPPGHIPADIDIKGKVKEAKVSEGKVEEAPPKPVDFFEGTPASQPASKPPEQAPKEAKAAPPSQQQVEPVPPKKAPPAPEVKPVPKPAPGEGAPPAKLPFREATPAPGSKPLVAERTPPPKPAPSREPTPLPKQAASTPAPPPKPLKDEKSKAAPSPRKSEVRPGREIQGLEKEESGPKKSSPVPLIIEVVLLVVLVGYVLRIFKIL